MKVLGLKMSVPASFTVEELLDIVVDLQVVLLFFKAAVVVFSYIKLLYSKLESSRLKYYNKSYFLL